MLILTQNQPEHNKDNTMKPYLLLVSAFAAICILPFHIRAASVSAPKEAFHDLGVFAYESGEYEKALQFFRKAVAASPGNAEYLHSLSKTYLMLQQYNEAELQLKKAYALDEENPEIAFDLGLLFYETREYREAIPFFQRSVETSTQIPPKSVYMLGICFFRERQYNSALGYFETMMQMDPAIRPDLSYYAGICQAKINLQKAALNSFEFVVQHSEKPSLQDQAKQWIDTLSKMKTRIRPLRIMAKMGAQYDDNVRLEPLDLDLYEDEKDFVWKGFVSARYTLQGNSPLQVGLGYSQYQTIHDDATEYDLTGSIGQFFMKYDCSPLTYGIYYTPAYYWLDGESYLLSHKIRPEVTLKLGPQVLGRFSFEYAANNHFEDLDREGKSNGFGTKWYFFMNNKDYLYAEAEIMENDADHPDHDYRRLDAGMGLSLRLRYDLFFMARGNFRQTDYFHEDSGYGFMREDSRYTGSLALSKDIYADILGVELEYEYTKNDSNILQYEYQRNTATLSLIAQY